MSFQMVLLRHDVQDVRIACFGTMSFQMVLLLLCGFLSRRLVLELCHSRWFYYCKSSLCTVDIVLELCHSRWFYYCQSMQRLPNPVLELCHSRWFYYTRVCIDAVTVVLELCHSRWFYYNQADGIPASVVLEPCHSRWFYYYMTRQLQRLRSWEIRAARRRRLRA